MATFIGSVLQKVLFAPLFMGVGGWGLFTKTNIVDIFHDFLNPLLGT